MVNNVYVGVGKYFVALVQYIMVLLEHNVVAVGKCLLVLAHNIKSVATECYGS